MCHSFMKAKTAAKSIAMSPRVIFFHGLESGCGGRKHRFLQGHFDDVICVDMQVSLLGLRKQNGILRNVLKNALRTAPWNLYRWSVQCSLKGCLELQQAELDATEPSQGVLVGSSWGGAVAALAIAQGLWKGPAVLIAPAYKLSLGNTGYDPAFNPSTVYAAIAEAVASDRGRILIVHGTNDETVPVADSQEMAQATGLELVEVPDGDHGMKCLLEGEHPQLISLIKRVSQVQKSSL